MGLWLMVSLSGTLVAQHQEDLNAIDGFGSYTQWNSYTNNTKLWLINGIQAGALAVYLQVSKVEGTSETADDPTNKIMMGGYELIALVDRVYQYPSLRYVPYAWIIADPAKWVRAIGG